MLGTAVRNTHFHPRSSTQKVDMRVLLLISSVFMVLTTAQLLCDPDTQYELGGQCCKLCATGTKMKVDVCLSPVCEACGDSEYQDKPNKDSMCKRQPYCDPNKNFQFAVHTSKQQKTECICKPGFHCSSKECITCVAHRTCGVGQGVQLRGNHTHDTACENCPHGTFSNESSSDGVCMKWTQCADGFEVDIEGTDRSDTKCVERRNHTLVICIVPVIAVTVALLAALFIFKKKSRSIKETTKGCVECLGPSETMMEEPRTPVENDDLHGISENGKLVTQEFGKGEVLSRQESQMETICDI